MVESNLAAVDRLVRELDEAAPLEPKVAAELYQAFSRRTSDRMVDERIGWGEASGSPVFSDADHEDIPAFIKSKNQDIEWQCETVSAFFRHRLKTGDIVPPHYPMRVAILIRKAKDVERERAFLAAWCRHFGEDGWFGERLRKMKKDY